MLSQVLEKSFVHRKQPIGNLKTLVRNVKSGCCASEIIHKNLEFQQTNAEAELIIRFGCRAVSQVLHNPTICKILRKRSGLSAVTLVQHSSSSSLCLSTLKQGVRAGEPSVHAVYGLGGGCIRELLKP